MELGQFPESKLYFDKAISLNGTNPDFWCNRAQSYYKFERYELSYEDFSKALKLSPEDPVIYYSVGMCLFETKKYKKAIDMLKMSLNKEQECFSEMKANSYYHIGISYCRRGKFDKSIYPFTQVFLIIESSALN